MSRHVGRKQRWTQESPKRHRSALGTVVYEQNAWYALAEYRTQAPQTAASDLASWVTHPLRLGPFKRPRNAMVALEREAAFLKNRHGAGILFGDQVWAEATGTSGTSRERGAAELP
jgi:hypothetical protein